MLFENLIQPIENEVSLIMKKQDFDFIKNYLDNDILLKDYIIIKKTSEHKVKVFYNDKIITLTDSLGFAYLIGWWCDGSITGSQADRLSTLCRTYNDRF